MNTQNLITSTTSNTTDAAANEAFLAQFKSDTGWNYGDAVDMAVECRRDDRLFGSCLLGNISPKRRNLRNRSRQDSRRVETPDQKFQRQTGWTFADAVDMASEVQRENRIFGVRRFN